MFYSTVLILHSGCHDVHAVRQKDERGFQNFKTLLVCESKLRFKGKILEKSFLM